MRASSFVIICALCASSAEAAPRPLTWADAVSVARESNPDVKSAKATVDSSAAQVKATRAAFWPKLNAEAGWGRAGERTWLTGSNVTDRGSFSAGLTANLNLFNGFADTNRLSQSQAREQLSLSKLVATRAQTSSDLKSAFVLLGIANRSVKLHEEILVRRKQNIDLIRLRYENGNENKGSVVLSQAIFEEAKADLQQAKLEQATAVTRLARLLGIAEGEGFDVRGALPLKPAPNVADFSALVPQTPEREQAVLDERVRRYEVSIARGVYSPSVNLNGSAGRFGAEFFPQDDRWAVGVVVSLPLFNGGKDAYTVQSARADLSASESAREAVERQLVVKLRTAHTGYVLAEVRERIANEFVAAMKLRVEINQRKYENGLMSFDDWYNGENDYVGREKDKLQKQRDRATAEAEWDRILGQGDL